MLRRTPRGSSAGPQHRLPRRSLVLLCAALRGSARDAALSGLVGVALLMSAACDRRAAVSEPGAGAPEAGLAGQAEPGASAGSSAPTVAEAGSPPVKVDPLRVTFADGSDLELRFQGEAWATTIAAKRLILLEEDFRRLQAIDPATGAQSWRLEAQSDPGGQHDLYALDDRVFLHAGPRLVMVDAAAGRRLGEAKAYYNGGESGCRLRIEGDACAYVCGCTLQPIDCVSGAQVGPSFPSSENHIYFDMAEPHDTVCPIQPRLLGRAGDRSVALVEGADGLMGAIVVAQASPWKRSSRSLPSAKVTRRGSAFTGGEPASAAVGAGEPADAPGPASPASPSGAPAPGSDTAARRSQAALSSSATPTSPDSAASRARLRRPPHRRTSDRRDRPRWRPADDPRGVRRSTA